MDYGIEGKLNGNLPEQDLELVRRLSLRWMRSVGPHNKWAKTGKRCTEMIEGHHWTDEEKAILAKISRTALTINKIAPLYRLIMGYQSTNRMDISYLPTSDSVSSEDVAEILNAIMKIEAGRMELEFTDTEVFSDGLITGRGFWDTRLCFEENELGEMAATCEDPFSIYIDPDANTYDLNNSAAYLQKSLWTDIDDVNSKYGSAAAFAVQNLVSPAHTSQLVSFLGEQDVSPNRYFGAYADDKAMGNWADVYHTDFVDKQAKRLRLLESQYRITEIAPCFYDLATGTVKPIPEKWLKSENQHEIQKVLDYALTKGEQIEIIRRPVKKIRWTVTCADVLLYDKWSIYPAYTITGFFPYFRRGVTRGFVEDLIDPQREINKKRSVLNDILNRSANSGWIYEDGTLDPEEEENLRMYGSSPGINVKWKRGPNSSGPPQRIEPGNYPQGLERLEEKNAMDLYQISGVNESALGQLDRVQSGRAIEARQRQAVLAIQPYQDNFARSKKICGKRFLEIMQCYYNEERVYRTIGEDSKLAVYEINKKIMTGDNSIGRMNDITVGRYAVEIDQTPMSATFKQGQFEETMLLLEKLGPIGMALAQSAPDLIIDQTSLPRKQEWKEKLMQASAMVPPEAAQAAGSGGQPIPVGPAAGTPEGMPS